MSVCQPFSYPVPTGNSGSETGSQSCPELGCAVLGQAMPGSCPREFWVPPQNPSSLRPCGDLAGLGAQLNRCAPVPVSMFFGNFPDIDDDTWRACGSSGPNSCSLLFCRDLGAPLEYSVCLQTDCGTPSRPHTSPGARASLCLTRQGRKDASHIDPECFGDPRSHPDRCDCNFSLLLPDTRICTEGAQEQADQGWWPLKGRATAVASEPTAEWEEARALHHASHGVAPSLARWVIGNPDPLQSCPKCG